MDFLVWVQARGNAIYVPYGDVRVYFLAFEHETGCLFSSPTLNRVPNLYDYSDPGCTFTVLFGTLPLVST